MSSVESNVAPPGFEGLAEDAEKQAAKAEKQLRKIGKQAADAEKKGAQCFREALAIIMENHKLYSSADFLQRAAIVYVGADTDNWDGSAQTVKNTKGIFDKAWRFAGIFGEEAVKTFLTVLEQLPGRGQENARKLLKAAIDMLGKTPEKLTEEWLREAHAGRVPTKPISETQRQRDADKQEADKIAPAEPTSPRPEGVVGFARRPLKEVWKPSVINFDEMVKRVTALGVMNDEADDAIQAFNSAFVVLEGIIEAAIEAEAREANVQVERTDDTDMPELAEAA